MKKILAIFSLAILFSACDQKTDATDNFFEVKGLKDSYEFAADLGQQESFDVVSDNVLWEIDCQAEWLSVSPMRSLGGYETVTITPLNNDSSSPRSCDMVLTSENGYSKTVKIVQRGI